MCSHFRSWHGLTPESFFGKEVGKRKWCETFAGPLVRRLSRAGVLRFIFSKEMLILLCFFRVFFVFFFLWFLLCFSGAPEHKKKHKKEHQKNTSHTTKKAQKKHNSYHKEKHKKTQFIPQKNTKKHNSYYKKKHKQKHNSYQKKKSFSFFSASVSVFFVFFSAFGKSLLLKHFKLASPAQLQPPAQPASPPGL